MCEFGCRIRDGGPTSTPQAGPHHLHSLAEVTVSKDDEGRLPSQLQGHLLHVTQGAAERDRDWYSRAGSLGD